MRVRHFDYLFCSADYYTVIRFNSESSYESSDSAQQNLEPAGYFYYVIRCLQGDTVRRSLHDRQRCAATSHYQRFHGSTYGCRSVQEPQRGNKLIREHILIPHFCTVRQPKSAVRDTRWRSTMCAVPVLTDAGEFMPLRATGSVNEHSFILNAVATLLHRVIPIANLSSERGWWLKCQTRG